MCFGLFVGAAAASAFVLSTSRPEQPLLLSMFEAANGFVQFCSFALNTIRFNSIYKNNNKNTMMSPHVCNTVSFSMTL